jgi:hypothetical protein
MVFCIACRVRKHPEHGLSKFMVAHASAAHLRGRTCVEEHQLEPWQLVRDSRSRCLMARVGMLRGVGTAGMPVPIVDFLFLQPLWLCGCQDLHSRQKIFRRRAWDAPQRCHLDPGLGLMLRRAAGLVARFVRLILSWELDRIVAVSHDRSPLVRKQLFHTRLLLRLQLRFVDGICLRARNGASVARLWHWPVMCCTGTPTWRSVSDTPCLHCNSKPSATLVLRAPFLLRPPSWSGIGDSFPRMGLVIISILAPVPKYQLVAPLHARPTGKLMPDFCDYGSHCVASGMQRLDATPGANRAVCGLHGKCAIRPRVCLGAATVPVLRVWAVWQCAQHLEDRARRAPVDGRVARVPEGKGGAKDGH